MACRYAEGFQNLGFGGVLWVLSFAGERKGAAGGKCSGRTESSAPTKCSKNPCKAGWDEKNKIVPGVLPRTMPKHRDTTLLRRLLTQVGLMKCRYTSALLRAPPSEPKAQVPSTRRLRSHVPPSVPRPLSPGRALFGGLKWGTLSFTAFTVSHSHVAVKNDWIFRVCGRKRREAFLAFTITYYIILPGRLCQCFCWVLSFGVL